MDEINEKRLRKKGLTTKKEVIEMIKNDYEDIETLVCVSLTKDGFIEVYSSFAESPQKVIGIIDSGSYILKRECYD